MEYTLFTIIGFMLYLWIRAELVAYRYRKEAREEKAFWKEWRRRKNAGWKSGR